MAINIESFHTILHLHPDED